MPSPHRTFQPTRQDDEICFLLSLREMLIVQLRYQTASRVIALIDQALAKARRGPRKSNSQAGANSPAS